MTSQVTNVLRSDNGQASVEVHTATDRYLDQFVRMRCAPDILASKVFPNAKEITESLAAWNAVRKHLGVEWLRRDDVALLDVGAGHTPRTALLAAHLSRWSCHAIDPHMNLTGGLRAERVMRVRCLIQRYRFDGPQRYAVVLAVHSHAPLLDSILACGQAVPLLLVAMPCCTPLELPEPPTAEYQDWGVHSERRTVRVWDAYALISVLLSLSDKAGGTTKRACLTCMTTAPGGGR